jgi:flagellar basal body-associated protein FliL
MTTEATTTTNPQEEKKVPSIIPLAVGLVGLLVVIVGAFLYSVAERASEERNATVILVVAVSLIGVARIVQETRISARK